MEWFDEVSAGYLKVTEGKHEIMIYEDPETIESKFGKPQWTFPNAELDGIRGILVASKRLMAAIAGLYKEKKSHSEGEVYPMAFGVERIGMDLKTQYRIFKLSEQVVL
jgi:hypothetical protein